MPSRASLPIGSATKLGGTVVVENVAGAGGAIGTVRAARAEADGYTLLFSVESSIVIQKLVSPSLVPIDPLKDFQPISMVGSSPLILLGAQGFPGQQHRRADEAVEGQSRQSTTTRARASAPRCILPAR